MVKTLALIIILFAAFLARGQQNLVINGDFEQINQCSGYWGNLNTAIGCTIANFGSPEIFNVCSQYGVAVPQNYFGNQYPHSGNGYIGGWCYYYNDPQVPVYREYTQLKLSAPLIVGKKYCLSYYVSTAAPGSFACNGLGMLLTTGPYYEDTQASITGLTAQLIDTTIITDTTGWTLISGEIIVDSAYEYVTVGNFFNDTLTQRIQFANPLNFSMFGHGAYVYMDDVSVTECGKPTIPNVFTPTAPDGINDAFVIENLPANSQLTIYNRWGTKVFESMDYKNDWDGEGHSPGVYYYILATPTGKSYRGTVTVL